MFNNNAANIQQEDDSYTANERLVDIKKFPANGIEKTGDWHDAIDMTFVQLDPGVFQSDTCLVDLHDVFIVESKSNLRHFSCGNLPGYIRFTFPLNIQGPFFSKNALYRKGKQIVHSDEENTCSCAVIPENFQQLIVGIKIEALSKYLNKEEIYSFINVIRSNEQIYIDGPYNEMATHFVHHIFEKAVRIRQESPDNNLFAGQNSRLIILFLSEYISNHPEEIKSRVNNSSHEKILSRGLDFIIHHAKEAISMERLASEIFASKRNIQYAFSELVDMTPMEFSRIVRLNAIREELLGTDIDSTSVLNILHKFGITNSGRFRHEYYNFFKEYPADTLSRSADSQDFLNLSTLKK